MCWSLACRGAVGLHQDQQQPPEAPVVTAIHHWRACYCGRVVVLVRVRVRVWFRFRVRARVWFRVMVRTRVRARVWFRLRSGV